MQKYTNSESVTHNDDGSWTTKIEYTEFPATTAQKVVGVAGLAVVSALAFAPLVLVIVEERREAKRIKQEEAAKQAD